MTTSKSPVAALRAQAGKMAMTLKKASRDNAAPAGATVKFGIVMDDKVVTIEMAWETIRTTSEAGLCEFIVRHMRGAPDREH